MSPKPNNNNNNKSNNYPTTTKKRRVLLNSCKPAWTYKRTPKELEEQRGLSLHLKIKLWGANHTVTRSLTKEYRDWKAKHPRPPPSPTPPGYKGLFYESDSDEDDF